MVLATDEHRGTRWQQRPSGSTWDPALALRLRTGFGDDGRFVPLDSLLSRIRQGIFAGSYGRGDFRVRTIRVSDLHPLLIGDGELWKLAPPSVGRHLASNGDVLVPRVGRLGKVGCVTHATEPMVPREGVLVVRPLRREWGAAIASALCTKHVCDWLGGLLSRTRSASLTIEQLSAISIPAPQHFDFAQPEKLVQAAGELVKKGCEMVNWVRGQLGMILEGAPAEPTKRRFKWLADPKWLQGWGWSDVERYLLISSLPIGSLVRLGDLINLDAFRVKTIDVHGGIKGLESDDFRPDWYLAMPTTRAELACESFEPALEDKTKRFFEVDRECLLIPTAGDITASPVVIPSEIIRQNPSPVMVPIHWLPLVNLPVPRVLALVLDHPFVRLQRQLAGAFANIKHITRDDLANLLIPVVNEAIWDQWELELRHAHRLFIQADAQAKKAINIAEGWYE